MLALSKVSINASHKLRNKQTQRKKDYEFPKILPYASSTSLATSNSVTITI
jgi:hypothetical protein